VEEEVIMADMSWDDVEQSEEYKLLPRAKKEAARKQYFDQVVKPHVPPVKLEAARNQFLQQTQPNAKRTPIEMLGRQVGLTARAGIEGIAALPYMIADAPTSIRRALGQKTGPKFSEALHETLTRAGLPESETSTERVVQDIAGGMTGAAGIAKGAQLASKSVTSPVALSTLKKLAENPAAQAIGGGVSGGASGEARELGFGPGVQTLAGLASTYRPGGGTPSPASIRNPLQAIKLQTLKEGTAAGYKVAPTHIERSAGRELLEDIGQKGATNQEMSLHNATITTKLAKEGSGLQPTQLLHESNLADARWEMAEPYRQVAKVSPDAAHALDTWKNANAEAKLHWKEYQTNNKVSAKKQYDYWNELQETAQQIMEDEAKRTGNPKLIAELREARVKIAQNWDVDRALNVATGEVRPEVLGRMLDKRGVQGMTGPLSIIAKMHQAFPKAMVESAKVPTPGVSGARPLSALILGYEGYKYGGMAGAAAGAAAPYASAGARKVAGSSYFQRPLPEGQGVPLSAIGQTLATDRDFSR
jgi:hypothetical protein